MRWTPVTSESVRLGGWAPESVQADVASLPQVSLGEQDVWRLFGYTTRDMQRGIRSKMTLGEVDLHWPQLPHKACDPKHFVQTFKSNQQSL